jgi:hypothetical protein
MDFNIGPTFPMEYQWLIEQLQDVREKVTTLFSEIQALKDLDERVEDVSDENRRLVVLKFELLNRQIGRGLMIVEIFNKYGAKGSPFQSDLFDKMIEDLHSLSVTGMSTDTNEEDPDALDRMEKRLEQLKDLTNKSKRDDTKDDKKTSSKPSSKTSSRSSNNFMDTIRKKFK